MYDEMAMGCRVRGGVCGGAGNGGGGDKTMVIRGDGGCVD